MIALNRGRKVALCLVASAAVGVLGTLPVEAQQGPGRSSTKPAQQPAGASQAGESPRLQEVRVPTNTTDPIALVNGEVISRQQLADECVAREGKKILETLIARRLIEQSLRAKKMDVTAAEIDQEIENVAMKTAGVSREAWLLTLDKERGISPAQYARDIIYPALALKKLAAGRVQVTEQDIKDCFEANHGPKMRCRIIMVDNLHKAQAVWEELRKNPGGFERIAKERSMDSSTRALGGMLPEPIFRHAYPLEISRAAFAQLVDGDPKDTNPAHKPKDGDFTGPIQVNESAWLIMRREELMPGKSGSINDPNIRNLMKAQMYEVKLNEAIGSQFEELMRASSIDNKLTGQVKMAHEEQHPEYKAGLDQKVERMSNAGETQPNMPTGGKSNGGTVTPAGSSNRTPAGVPSDAASAASKLQQTIKTAPRTAAPSGN